MTDRELLGLAAKAGRCAVSASKTVRQIPMPMDDKIEAWVQQAMQLADARELARSNVAQSFWSNEAKEQLARASDDLAAHLRTTPEGFVLVPTKLSRAMEAVLENEKGAYQTGDDLYADLIAASQESGA